MRPAVLTDSLEEVPTVGRDSSDHLQCLISNHFSFFEIASNDSYSAIEREKRLKKWKRQWKIEPIQKSNPGWRDLYFDLT